MCRSASRRSDSDGQIVIDVKNAMTRAMGEEKRKFTRLRARLLASSAADGDDVGIFGRVRDISLQGAFIEGVRRYAKGSRCQVAFIFSDSGKEARIRTACVVARTDASGMGVCFERIDAEGLPLLIQLVLSKAKVPAELADEVEAALGLLSER